MLGDREEGGGKYNLIDSAVDTFSIGNLIKRVFLFIVFGFLLGLKYLIQNLDTVGRSGGGIFAYISAIIDAQMQGVKIALGSMWTVIVTPHLYYETHAWGSIVFSVLSIVFLIMFFYQPISMIINVIDGKKGNSTGMALRVFVTFIVVIISSSVVFYSFGGETFTSNLQNQTDIEEPTNSTDEGPINKPGVDISEVDTSNTSTVIDLL